MNDVQSEPQNNQKRAILGVSVLYAQGIFVTVIGFVFTIIVSRLLSVYEFGQLTTLVLFLSILSTLGSLSIHYAAPRFISETLGREDQHLAHRIAFNVVLLGLIFSLLIGLVTLTMVPISFNILGVGLSSNFPWYAFTIDVTLSCFTFFIVGTEQGFKRYRRMAILLLLIAVLRYSIGATFLIWGYGLNGLILGLALGNVVGTLLAILSVFSLFDRHHHYDWSTIRTIIHFCMPLLVSMAIGVVNSNLGSIILLSFGNVSLVGIYGIGITISSVYWIASRSMLNVGLPEQSNAFGARGKGGLIAVSQVISRYVYILIPYMTIMMACITPYLISLVLPVAYLDASVVAILIFGVHSVFCYEIVANGYLLTIGETTELLRTSIAAFIVCLISGLLLIPPFGILGAAIAKACMDCVLAFYPAFIVRRHFGLGINATYQMRALIPALGIIIPAISLWFLFSPIIALPLVILFGSLIYLLGLRLLHVISHEDLVTLVSLFPKRGRQLLLQLGSKILLRSSNQSHSHTE
jgi:O-antigen/teichoic acid export membrane protein